MRRIISYLLAIVVTISCSRKITSNEISLSQSSALPGETILINSGKKTLTPNNKVNITFNGVSGQVIAIRDSLIEVLVPELKAGDAKIVINADGEVFGNSSIVIQEHSTRKLIFMISHDGKVEKIGEKLSNDEIASPDLTAGNKISYDLLDSATQIIASGLIDNPLEGMEVFDDPQKKIYREKDSHMGGSFTINVPNIKGNMKLRLFDVRLPGDATNKQYLERKKLLAEIDVTGQ